MGAGELFPRAFAEPPSALSWPLSGVFGVPTHVIWCSLATLPGYSVSTLKAETVAMRWPSGSPTTWRHNPTGWFSLIPAWKEGQQRNCTLLKATSRIMRWASGLPSFCPLPWALCAFFSVHRTPWEASVRKPWQWFRRVVQGTTYTLRMERDLGWGLSECWDLRGAWRVRYRCVEGRARADLWGDGIRGKLAGSWVWWLMPSTQEAKIGGSLWI